MDAPNAINKLEYPIVAILKNRETNRYYPAVFEIDHPFKAHRVKMIHTDGFPNYDYALQHIEFISLWLDAARYSSVVFFWNGEPNPVIHMYFPPDTLTAAPIPLYTLPRKTPILI